MNKRTIIYLILVLLYFCISAQAQVTVTEIKPLRVGDSLPETFWQQAFTIYANGKTTKQSLEKYKGKLLILDFWATWCGSCISKFPLIANLQKTHSDFSILLVSKLKTDKNIEKVKKSIDVNGPQLSTIVADEFLGGLFPHSQLPHYVWVAANGRIIAITASQFITTANIIHLSNNVIKEVNAP